ncbi:ABC transporter substrate-binding protein [Lacibacterium aquatile]|uniref:ABC transporter substrate-binding protein n=1 Tax=Lacibacterium aquatile TaxID=1168082 RepID=A0ABW5DK03_9PROT
MAKSETNQLTAAWSVDRRGFLKGVASAAALTAIPSHVFAQAGGKESPDLAKLVAEGKLPPLAQRLPENPDVIQVKDIGKYGGTLRRGLRGSSDHNGILKVIGPQNFVRWNVEFTGVVPNLAHKWDVNADATEFTFYLRKGLKWSDGKPFTADDVLFSIEDCAKNPELFKATPSVIVIGGKPVEVTKVDETTVKFKFAAPYALFLENLATPLGQHTTLFAKHYCSQFHPKYNPNAEAAAKAAGQSDWAAGFRAKCGDIEIPSRWGNPERPTMDPWIIKEAYTGGATRVVAVRNPYFWQVDQQGNQLPYIDQVNYSISQDVESLMLDVVGGKIDYQDRHINSLANKPTLSQNTKRGDYHLVELIAANAQQVQIHLNILHKDPKMREMLGNKEFRKALSLGINRQEIIDLVYLGQSQPYQTSPRPGHPWYHEKLAKQFIEHNPTEANAILDKLGYNKKDGQGMRLRPDGQKVFFSIDVIPTLYPDQVDALELVKRHWADIGVDIKVNTIERALYYTRGDNNDHDAASWSGSGGLDMMFDPRDYFAYHPQGSRYAIPWANWLTSGGKSGEEPPESQKKRMALFDQARGTTDLAKRAEYVKQLLDLTYEAFETVGVCLGVNSFGVCKNNLMNVPEKMPDSWSYPNPAPTLPAQYFFKT